jgi:hypothetical protein
VCGGEIEGLVVVNDGAIEFLQVFFFFFFFSLQTKNTRPLRHLPTFLYIYSLQCIQSIR